MSWERCWRCVPRRLASPTFANEFLDEHTDKVQQLVESFVEFVHTAQARITGPAFSHALDLIQRGLGHDALALEGAKSQFRMWRCRLQQAQAAAIQGKQLALQDVVSL